MRVCVCAWVYVCVALLDCFAQSTTISSDSSSGEDEEEQLDGFDIDEVQPVPEQWKPKYKHFGKEGTRAA